MRGNREYMAIISTESESENSKESERRNEREKSGN